MKLKVKSTKGSVVTDVDGNTSLYTLLSTLVSLDELSNGDDNTVLSVKAGYPPKPISMSDVNAQISTLGIRSGDQIFVEFASQGNKSPLPPPLDVAATLIPGSDTFLILRNVPDDNACMFNAISYALAPHVLVLPQELRMQVASHIADNPTLFFEAILGRPRSQYCEWIKRKDSWGGAIELGIVSNLYGVRINCYDVQSGNDIVFEQLGSQPTSFIVLVYSGIHYDVLAENKQCVASKLPAQMQRVPGDTRLWSHERATNILEAARELCAKLQKQHYSTNTTTFRVRCLDCYQILVGENEAQRHALEKGHVRFGEVL